MDVTMERFQRLAATMRRNAPPSCLGDGATGREISEAEQRLGVAFPTSYKWFLQEFGVAAWPDYIYGVHSSSLRGLLIVANTEEERHDLSPHIPRHLIPFNPDGAGNNRCLDTGKSVHGECPVVFWNHERDERQQPEQTHASFLDWLEEKIEFMLEE